MMRACFCVGPKPGHELCPCRERAVANRDHETFMKGVAFAQAMGRKIGGPDSKFKPKGVPGSIYNDADATP